MRSEEIVRLSDQMAGAHITQRRLSDLSGVDESTISRILSKETFDPGYSKVRDLVIALGWSLDALAGITRAQAEDQKPSDALIDIYERALDSKNRWIKRLFTLCCVLAAILAVIVFYFIWDATNPTDGIIKY